MRRRLAQAIAILAFAIPRYAQADGSAADAPAPRATSREEKAPAPSAASIAPQGPIHYTLEGIELRGNTHTAGRVILRYLHFRAGDVLDVNDPEITLTRYRLLGTGFFSSVQLSLRRGSQRGNAVLVIEVTERNTFIVQNLWLGIAADEDTAGNAKPLSAFVGLKVAETNIAGTGITLGAGAGLAADQLALRVFFEDPAIAGTGWSALVSVLYNDARDFFGNRAVSFESPLLEQREVTDYAVVDCSANSRESGAAAAALAQEWAEEYSGNDGVVISVVKEASRQVASFPSVSPRRMAVTGRHELTVYFAAQHPMIASAIARLVSTSTRAVCTSESCRPCVSAVATWSQ